MMEHGTLFDFNKLDILDLVDRTNVFNGKSSSRTRIIWTTVTSVMVSEIYLNTLHVV